MGLTDFTRAASAIARRAKDSFDTILTGGEVRDDDRLGVRQVDAGRACGFWIPCHQGKCRRRSIPRTWATIMWTCVAWQLRNLVDDLAVASVAFHRDVPAKRSEPSVYDESPMCWCQRDEKEPRLLPSARSTQVRSRLDPLTNRLPRS